MKLNSNFSEYESKKINLKGIWKLLHIRHGGNVPLRDVSVETCGTPEHVTQEKTGYVDMNMNLKHI